MQAPSPDPLQDPNYLLDPFDTLFYSLDDFAHEYLSLHDIAEAYNTIYLRLRASGSQLASPAAQEYPALQFLKNNHAAIATVFTRDVSRALTLPPGLSRRLSPSIDFSRSGSREASEEARYAKDSTVVCHFALRVIAQLFQSLAIYDALPEDDVLTLLDAVIAILKTPILPSFNASKTYALSIWVLRTQTLPRSLICRRADELTGALKRIVGKTPSHVTIDLIIDGLEAINSLLASHSDIFLQPFCTLIPSILIHLTASSPQLRHQAACTLAAYCSLIVQPITDTSSSVRQSIAKHVQSFLEAQTSPTASFPTDESLSDLLESALRAANPFEPGGGATWALTAVACLTLLHGPSIFYHKQALRLCMEMTGKALNQSHPLIRDLHPHGWRCFIWALGRLCEGLGEDMQDDARVELEDKVGRVLRIIGVELGHGLGIAFVRTLLGLAPPDPASKLGQHPASWGVSRAVSIVEEMLRHKNKDLQNVGLEAFFKLLMGTDSEAPSVGPGESGGVLTHALVDGTILFADEDELWTTLKFIPVKGAKQIRQLSPMEIVHCWDALIACWVLIVGRLLESHTSVTVDEKFLFVWRNLLSSKLQSTSQQELSVFCSKAGTVVTKFLPVSVHQGTSVSNTSAARQWQSLQIMQQLWDVMIEGLSGSVCLRVAALAILSPILKFTFDLTHDSVKGAWSTLCASLLTAASPDALKDLSIDSDEQGAVELRRQLWTALASSWDMRRDQQGYADALSFLVMPFGYWSLSDLEFDLWEAVLERATMSQSAAPEQTLAVADSVGRCLLDDELRLPVPSRVNFATALIRIVTLDETYPFPFDAFSFVNATLVASYPFPDQTSPCLDLLSIVHNQVLLTPGSLLVTLLSSLEECLCRWIKDAEAVTSVQQYNSIIIPLYKAILTGLKDTVPTMSTLFATTPLLVSAFTRIPSPAWGPIAFKEFFDDMFLHHGRPAHEFPDELLFCARCCVESYGGEMLPGMEESVSQSQSQDRSRDHVKLESVLTSLSTPLNSLPESKQAEFVQGSSSLVSSSRPPQSNPISASADFQLPPPGHAITAPVASFPSAALASNESTSGESRRKRSRSTRPSQRAAASVERSPLPIGTVSSSKKRASGGSAPSPKKRKLNAAEGAPVPHTRSQSAPTNRVSSPKAAPTRRAASRASDPVRKMVFDCVEVEPYEVIRRRHAKTRSKMKAPVKVRVKGKGKRKEEQPASPQEDYDNWETTLGTPQTIKLRNELLRDQEIVPETPDANYISPEQYTFPTLPTQGSPTRHLTAASAPPSLPTPTSSPLRGYGSSSKNASEPILPRHPPASEAPPLLRAHSSSARLNILRQAHDILTSGGLSQMQMPDLIMANQIVEEMGVAVNGKLRKRLADGTG
ncbi:hypothetical protein DENSPDRAFT_640877 [Dentipellis sp. KUC8613]|nr:hypothetical protein DENSPDRAFT_640877 [Dentipellis sp. KUC8613]